jgi:hypothetical protein
MMGQTEKDVIKKPFLTSLVFSAAYVLMGCAAVGVLPTSDPNQKLNDAIALMSQNRHLRAKQFSEEALKIFDEQMDQRGAARAHAVLAEALRDGKGPGLPDLAGAEREFNLAAEVWSQLKEPKWQAFNLYAVAGVQSLAGKDKSACETLGRSKKIYSQAKDFSVATESFEKGGAFKFQDYPTLEKSFKCGSN